MEFLSVQPGVVVRLLLPSIDCGLKISTQPEPQEQVFSINFGQYELKAAELGRLVNCSKASDQLTPPCVEPPPAQCHVFYGGSVPVYSEDITAIPLREALPNLGRILKNTGSTQVGMGGEIPPEHE